MTTAHSAIIRTLLYFDIFGHPLTKSELRSFLGISINRDDYENSLRDLTSMNLVRNDKGYYFLPLNGSSADDRIIKLNRSKRYRRISRFISGLIYLHPFVKGVLVSGSLSKNVFSKKDDIDFFVITDPGRLWISRASLMLFKKIFLLNSKKYFCINYFVDSENLEIREKNIFTATEIAFLIPMRNPAMCGKFFRANDWISRYFPNLSIDLSTCSRGSGNFFKRIAEKLFHGRIGERLDSRFMEIYRKRARKKYGRTDRDHFDLNFRSEKNIAKYHPNGFQHFVLEKYEAKISEFQDTYQIDLTS